MGLLIRSTMSGSIVALVSTFISIDVVAVILDGVLLLISLSSGSETVLGILVSPSMASSVPSRADLCQLTGVLSVC